MTPELINLRCPYCRSEISADQGTGGYSCCGTYPTLDGYSCDNYACGATWDSRGNAIKPGDINAATR